MKIAEFIRLKYRQPNFTVPRDPPAEPSEHLQDTSFLSEDIPHDDSIQSDKEEDEVVPLTF